MLVKSVRDGIFTERPPQMEEHNPEHGQRVD